jgi:hypothetical protein
VSLALNTPGEPGPVRRCWSCKAPNDGHSQVTDEPAEPVLPKDGDLGICAYCAEPLIFEGEGTRSLTYDEWCEAMANPFFRAAYDAVRMVARRRE